MNGADQHQVLLRGRLWISLGFGAGGFVLALIVNPPIIPEFLTLLAFQFIINQPFLWRRLFKVGDRALARCHLYLDILVVTYGIHLFGGARSGPLVALYVLIMFQAALINGPREGVITALISLAALFGDFYLERLGVIHPHPALLVENPDPAHLAAVILTTAVIFLTPPFVGLRVYRLILEQGRVLRRTVARSSRIFNEAGDALLILGGGGIILQANPAAGRLFGVSHAGLIGKMFTEVLPTETADDFAVLLDNASKGERVSGRDLRLVLPDGMEKVVEVGVSPIAQTERDRAGAFVIFRDVTETRRMAQELRNYSEELYRRVEERTAELEESREIYMSLFEKAAVPLCWLDANGVLQSANQPFFELTGLDQAAQGSLPLTNILSEANEKVAQFLDRLRRGFEAPTRLELRINRPGGEQVWTEWFIRFEPLTDQMLVSMIDISESKKAEQALKESEERYRRLVETSPDAITMTDLTGKIVMANRQSALIHGVASEDELIGKDAFELIAEGERERAVKNTARTLTEGKIEAVGYELLRADGSTFDGEISASLIRDAEGKPLAFIGVTRDVTARKKAEQELKKYRDELERLVKQRTAELDDQREFLECVVNSAYDGIFVLDEKMDYVLVNAASEKISGSPPSIWLGKRAGSLLHPEDLAKSEQAFKNALNGEHSQFEIKLKGASDDYRTMVLRLTPLTWMGKKHVLGVATDMTEIKKAEEATRQSEQKYRMLFEASPDAMALVSLDGVILDFNQPVTLVSGMSREELIGKSFRELGILKDENVSEYAGIMVRMAKGEKGPESLEIEVTEQDGRPRYLEVHPSLVMKDDKPYAILVVTKDVTARRLAQKALEESEKRYRMIAENVADVVWTSELPSLRPTYIAPSIRNIRGYTAEECMIQSPEQVYTPDSLKRALATLVEELALEEKAGADPDRTRAIELEQTTKAGGTVWTEERMAFLRDEHGKAIGIIGVTRDISERKRAENELRKHKEKLEQLVEERTRELMESEKRYRGLFEDSLDAVFATSRGGALLSANRAVTEISGYSHQELIGMNVMSFYTDPEDRDRYMEMMEREGSVREFELKLRTKDGSIRDCLITSSVRLSEQGEVIGYQGILRDVTERKKAEEALVQSELRYRTLVETSPDAIIALDPTGRILMANQRAVELWGGPGVDALLGRNAFELIAPREVERAAVDLQKVLAQGRIADYEVALLRNDGSEYQGEASAAAVQGAEGGAMALFVIFRDITERKRMQEAQRELEQQLAEARRMAVAGQMAAGVAHEMNSPLTAVSYYAQALDKAKRLAKADREKITRITAAADRIQELVSGLINFASADSAEFEPVDLNSVATQVLDAMAHECEMRPKAKIKLLLGSRLPKLDGSTSHLFQLVSNLMLNALQALPARGGEVVISTGAEKGRLVLEVRDTGDGIAKKDLPNIFNPFFSRKQGEKGTGLGLAIVAQVARAHNAAIDVKSEPGKGSTFKVVFPLRKSSEKK